jgi:uncharacterized protein (DUF1684 family)
MRWMLAATLISCSAFAQAPADHAQQVEQWRSARVERLRQPQGWLSLVGLHWLEPGTHSIGSAPDNGVVLSTGPARLGTIEFAAGKVHFTAAADGGATIGGAAPAGKVELAPDSSGAPTTLAFDGGEATLQVIERGGRYGLRVRDARANTRSGFVGIENYPTDAGWRYDARFEPHPPGRTIEIANVIGQLEPMANPGTVEFERDGKRYKLEAVDEGDGQLFLIFADRTNGKETYGAGRFLYAAPAVDGRTEVDFNKAYNPPCAFNAYSTCPLPPPENRLDLAVTAGEKKYAGPTH